MNVLWNVVVLNLTSNVGYLDNTTVNDVIAYVIAGSGFDNVDVSLWNDTYRLELNGLYSKWRGNRTMLDMFNFIFNENGYRCEDLFHACWAGSQTMDCCSIFEPTYVMLRGRCFRLVDIYNQTDFDEIDKLSVYFNNIEGVLAGTKKRQQIIMYVGDSHPEIGIYPRFYLNYRDWNRVRFTQRRVSMLSDNPMCSTRPLDQGKSTCFVHKWIQRALLSPLNCTLPYFKGMLPYVDDYPVCETSVVINDYRRIMSARLENYKCGVACERIENHMQMLTSPDSSRNIDFSYRLESSFTDLEYEQYSEIRLTTAAGFISELGGQSGLFVGCSVMSVVQLVLSILMIFTVCAQETYKQSIAYLFSVNTDVVHATPNTIHRQISSV